MKKIKNAKQGFTLIELLVVVLIIGILTAIALPQYNQIVLRSKFAKVKANVQALASAMDRYYLVNNKYPENLSELDVEVSDTNDTFYYTNSEIGDVGGQVSKNGRIVLNYYIVLTDSPVNYGQNVRKNTYYCIAYNKLGMHDAFKNLCQKDTGKTEYSYANKTYTWYAY